MNRHELLDIATISASKLLLRGGGFFSRSLASPPLEAVVHDATVDLEALRAGNVEMVDAQTSVGAFRTAYRVVRWTGADAPTLIYHHGSGERPFETEWFSSNSVRRIFGADGEAIPANLIVLRAPFHDRSSSAYVRAMGDLANFVGMLAASTALLETVTDRLERRGCPAVLASGISLGGWVVNLHRAVYGSADRYVPVFAGARLDELFLSSIYRKLAAESARTNPDVLRRVLDFEPAFRAVDADDCVPLLARYDRIIEFETQRPAYEDHDLAVLEKGHVTGSLATDDLRQHVRRAISET